MKLTKQFLAIALSFSLSLLSFLFIPVSNLNAQTKNNENQNIAIQRGYRTGYSDGYLAGYRDIIENAAKSYARHDDYARADRAYNQDYGTKEDYRDGYQQGFEAGYDTGFDKRSFDATIPISLKQRGVVKVDSELIAKSKTKIENPSDYKTTETNSSQTPPEKSVTYQSNTTETAVTTQPDNGGGNTVTAANTGDYKTRDRNGNQPPTMQTKTEKPTTVLTSDAILLIPADTELIVELTDDLDTEGGRVGDKFTARVVAPAEISGAIVEGRITKVQKPGRIKRRAEISLGFDRIIVTEDRWSNYAAILTEVLPIKGDNIKRVDTEGTVEGKSSTKSDIIKVGAATGTGLVIGAVVGGPVGAGVGAGVGAAFGVGAVVVERGKHIRLQKNQQLRIRTAYETQIR